LSDGSYKRVAAAIILRDERVLIAQRSVGDRLALKWEFPGGKLEPGETPEECLIREIGEELNLNITVSGHFMTSFFRNDTGMIELMAFLSEVQSGNMSLNVHADVRWVSLRELASFDFAPADIPIVHKLLEFTGLGAWME
jgi:8-oxo-dGTP diphosphatase